MDSDLPFDAGLMKKILSISMLFAALSLITACQQPLEFDAPRSLDSTALGGAPAEEESERTERHVDLIGTEIFVSNSLPSFPGGSSGPWFVDESALMLQAGITTRANVELLDLELEISHEQDFVFPLLTDPTLQVASVHLTLEPVAFESEEPESIVLSSADGDDVGIEIGTVDLMSATFQSTADYPASVELILQRSFVMDEDNQIVDAVIGFAFIRNEEDIPGAANIIFELNVSFLVFL